MLDVSALIGLVYHIVVIIHIGNYFKATENLKIR